MKCPVAARGGDEMTDDGRTIWYVRARIDGSYRSTVDRTAVVEST